MPRSNSLSCQTLEQLQRKAKQRGIVYSGKKKSQLISALRSGKSPRRKSPRRKYGRISPSSSYYRSPSYRNSCSKLSYKNCKASPTCTWVKGRKGSSKGYCRRKSARLGSPTLSMPIARSYISSPSPSTSAAMASDRFSGGRSIGRRGSPFRGKSFEQIMAEQRQKADNLRAPSAPLTPPVAPPAPPVGGLFGGLLG